MSCAYTFAVEAKANQGDAEYQCWDQHIVCLGKQSGESNRSKHDRKQWGCTTDCRQRAANDARRDECSITLDAQPLGVEG
jgi:hypothetical protein